MRNTAILGDALEVVSTLPDESVDLIVTDPPYGINYKSHKQNLDTRHGSVKINRDEYFAEIVGDDAVPLEWLRDAYRILKSDSAIYVFCRWDKWAILEAAVKAAGFSVKNMIVMNKTNHGMGDLAGAYAPKHELLLFATKGDHQLRFPEGRGTDVWIAPVLYSGQYRWHQNQKPLKWLSPAILNSSDAGDLVLDPFCGSGSTLVCARSLGRDFLGVEIDPATHADCLERIKQPCKRPSSQKGRFDMFAEKHA